MEKFIKIRAVVSNISIMDHPWGEKSVRIDLTEERELPGPLIVQKGEADALAREIIPVISQVLKSMPGFSLTKVRVPRLTIYLTEDEWDKIVHKPNIGDIIEVRIYEDKIVIGQ